MTTPNKTAVSSGEPITCAICHHQRYIDNQDLQFGVHKGFTIGKGKTLYWMMIWHSTGNVTVYSADGERPRWISGDTEITIHFEDVPVHY